MKIQKRVPLLLIGTFSSMFFVSFTAAVSAHGIYRDYNSFGISQPSVAVLMEGLSRNSGKPGNQNSDPREGLQQADGTLPPKENADSQSPSSNPGASQDASPSGDTGPIYPTADENGDAADTGQDAPIPGIPEEENTDAEKEQPPEPVSYEFTNVTQDYFDDALLIGDSRAVGVQLYSGWDNLTCYAESGMTVYNMFTRTVTDRDGKETTVEEALQEQTFGKIYLEIGINEMGTGNVDSFMEAYENAVQHLRELQPDADLFLCGIMYVRQSKSESDPIFNNPGIKERNERIAELADGQTIFYLDINEVTSDETGNLNPDYTWDEVHLLGKYNVLWTDYLSSHGIIK